MAYGLLLYKEIESPLGDQRVEIYKDGFAGTATEIVGLHKDGIAIAKDSSSLVQAITTSVLTLRLSDCEEIDYSQFFTPNATLFKVIWKTKVESAWETRWTGFITPDSFSENLAYRDTLTLTARDNLGRLGDYDFDMTRGQLVTIRSIITQGLTKAGVAMGLTFSTTKVASSPATTLAVDGLVNTSLLQGMTWRDAVELLLTGLGCTLAWNDANTFEVRDISQAPAASQAAFFINKSGFRQIRPAWKNLTIEQDYGRRDNFYEGQFSKGDCGGTGPTVKTFTPPSGSLWSSDFALLNPYNGAKNPGETIFVPVGNADTIADAMTYAQWVPQLNRAITLSMRCSNSTWKVNNLGNAIWAQKTIQTGVSPSGGNIPIKREYGLRYRFNIFMTVGTTKYVLRETWEVYDPATIAEPYLYFSMPGTGQGVDMEEEVNIYIGEIPGSGTLEFVVYKPLAYVTEDTGSTEPISYANTNDYGRITEITMAVEEGVGARAKRVAINADHNVQGSVAVRVGQVAPSLGNALLFLGGLFYTDTDHTPLTGFARAAGGSTFDLLELVGREYISYNNDNYDALSGTMMAEAAFRFDKAIEYGDKTYRIVGASLAIRSNTLTTQMLQEEVSFDTTVYTIETVDDEGRTTTTGGTGSIGQGTSFSSEVLRHLRLETLNAGQSDETTIMVCDITFASEKNIVAGGVGSGSGSGSGGGSLATLADVNLGTLSDGDILRYDTLTSHWYNTPLSISLGDLSNVAIGTPSNGQALVYNSTSGKWEPGNVSGGGVTVVSSDATIGTSLTTLGTIDGTPIKAKIASYLETSQFIASNIVTALGTTAVNRAKGDESGNTIKNFYAANLVYSNGSLVLKNGANTTLSTITGENIMGMLGLSSTDTIATQSWVSGLGYITSSALSGYMQTSQFTASNIVSTLGNTAVNRASADASGNTIASQTWVENKGYITSSALSGYMETADYTGSGTTPVNRAFADESGNNIKATYGAALDYSSSEGRLYLKTKDSTLVSWVTGSQIVSVIGNNAVARATADADGNAFSTAYLRKNVDDTMAGNLTIGASNANKSLMLYGTATISSTLDVGGNTTIGAKSTTGAAKTLTVYGRNNSTTPALTIGGVYGNNSAYVSSLYTASDGLHITTALNVAGNIVATGNIVAGSASDRRLKEDVRSITLQEAADLLSVLNPVVYRWNDEAAKLGGLRGIGRGFLADEYLDLLPNAGRKIWGDYDAIDYEQTIPYLVAGWQQQNLRIRILEGEIAYLKEENQRLNRRLRDVVQ